jgi:predicted nucleic acid-binding protein
MILVDTGFLLALAQPSDSLHSRARAWSQAVQDRLLLTEYVLVEAINSLSRVRDRTRAQRLAEAALDRDSFTFVPASRSLLDSGLELHRRRSDKDWSLTDCISFAIMRERQISQALAYDEHFEQAGFVPLLRMNPPVA